MQFIYTQLRRGFLGLFIGPTLIAVAFTLLDAWRGASAAAPGAAAR